MTKNFLKNVFDWFREVLEAADVPFVLLVLVVLPFVVPFVPAWVTARNLHEIMKFPKEIAFVGGATVELLGFAGAILLLRYITELVEDKSNRRWITVALTGFAYVFYLIAVIVINVILDWQAGKETYYVWVIFFLCLLSVPSGLLSASRIVTREHDSIKEKVRQENRNDKMERYRIKHGVRVYNSEAGSKTKYASDLRNKIAMTLEAHYRKHHAVIGASELCRKVGLDPHTQRAEVWKQIREWKRDNHIQ